MLQLGRFISEHPCNRRRPMRLEMAESLDQLRMNGVEHIRIDNRLPEFFPTFDGNGA
jgi:hypothetical protein